MRIFDGTQVRDATHWDGILSTRQMTPDELANQLWKLERRLRDAEFEENRIWLNELFSGLKVGKGWCYPEEKRIFKKIDDYHFQERDFDKSDDAFKAAAARFTKKIEKGLVTREYREDWTNTNDRPNKDRRGQPRVWHLIEDD